MKLGVWVLPSPQEAVVLMLHSPSTLALPQKNYFGIWQKSRSWSFLSKSRKEKSRKRPKQEHHMRCQRSVASAFRKFQVEKRGIIMSEKVLRVTCPTCMGSPFDSKRSD